MVREKPDHFEGSSHLVHASLARASGLPPFERTAYNSLQAFPPPGSFTAGPARLHWQKERKEKERRAALAKEQRASFCRYPGAKGT